MRRTAQALRVVDAHIVESLEETSGSVWPRSRAALRWERPRPFVGIPLGFDEDDVFDAESRNITEIAKQQDAVFVGRGAGLVLRNHPGLIRVFVHARESWRIAVAQRRYALTPAAARDLTRQSDRRAARFIDINPGDADKHLAGRRGYRGQPKHADLQSWLGLRGELV